MLESRYLKQFEHLAEFTKERPGSFVLVGPTALVEVLPEEELRTESGLYIGKANNQRQQASDFQPKLGIVLYLGEGFSDGNVSRLKPGMVIKLPTQLSLLSSFPGINEYTANTLALVNENDVLMWFNSATELQDIKRALNG
jgi:hypothetical protein